MSTRATLILSGIAILISILSVMLLDNGCKPLEDASSIQRDAQPFVDAGCKVLEALDSSGTAAKICATEEELAAIANAVRAARDPSARSWTPSTCQVIPSTTLCAQDRELVPAIRAALARRKDGGP